MRASALQRIGAGHIRCNLSHSCNCQTRASGTLGFLRINCCADGGTFGALGSQAVEGEIVTI